MEESRKGRDRRGRIRRGKKEDQGRNWVIYLETLLFPSEMTRNSFVCNFFCILCWPDIYIFIVELITIVHECK